ncbi:MAG TPA: ABC transporter permease [Gammaproteobacteria bacterium]|nr:ABC transporter permease [Gammaproteobacteria bacterium]
MKMKRFLAVFHARNLEFMRDRAALGWNLLFPVLLVFGFAFLYSDSSKDLYKVGIYNNVAKGKQAVSGALEKGFLNTRYIQFIPVTNLDSAIEKVDHHKLDLLLDPAGAGRYWINSTSPKGYIVERILWGADKSKSETMVKQVLSGREIRYVDWVMPGILAMNMMFGSLFGVGFVIVRYRKNGVLKRLKATPLTALEFLGAQVCSRLLLTITVAVFVYFGTDFFINFIMLGSYGTLLLVYLLGGLSLISLALILAARTESEEFAGGVLNLIVWPMMIFSGVWFSLDGLHPAAQNFAQLLPLTHLVNAARAVMNDGAGLTDILPQLITLAGMSVVFMIIGACLFKWK